VRSTFRECVTPTLKLKRKVCQEHFAAEIEGLYSGSTERSEGPS
jgi:long-subunit acyl-CoA synthetase (AMP-forming)